MKNDLDRFQESVDTFSTFTKLQKTLLITYAQKYAIRVDDLKGYQDAYDFQKNEIVTLAQKVSSSQKKLFRSFLSDLKDKVKSSINSFLCSLIPYTSKTSKSKELNRTLFPEGNSKDNNKTIIRLDSNGIIP